MTDVGNEKRSPGPRNKQATVASVTLQLRWRDDAEFREKLLNAVKESIKSRRNDPEFREQRAAAGRASTAKRWAVPDSVPDGYAKVYRRMVKEVGARRALPKVLELAKKEGLA
ncbi:MAG: hypothetical protein RLZZ283_179 [Candidatus Parcubacteria bacterium]|jgi:hypothetical protein